MSDDEYEYDYDNDDDYENEGNNEGDNEVENLLYEADDEKFDSPLTAIEKFQKVVELESKRGYDEFKHSFKALTNLVLLYCSLKKFSPMVLRYKEMLTYIQSVTRNEFQDAVNSVLDHLGSTTDVNVLSEMYEITLDLLKSANNERLWVSTNLKLARVYLESKKFGEVENILSMLKLSCKNTDGEDDIKKGNILLEVYCLEIQLCSLTLNHIRMKEIYPRTVHLNAAVSDPRTMGIVREEGGKLLMAEAKWDAAYNEFYQAFRNYQEAGNVRARDCLKYVVLASMLALTDINPFSAREAKVFAEDREIIAMSELRTALEVNDLGRFEKTINDKLNRILDEPFLMKYIAPLRRRMQEQALLNLAKPFSKVTLAYLETELALTLDEIETILVTLILDGKLDALIDQTTGILITTNTSTIASSHGKSFLLSSWASSLEYLAEDFESRIA